MFARYILRTTDLAGARAFYAQVAGPSFWSGAVALASLPERVAALGAPPHWLGVIAAGDAESMTVRVEALSGQRLGPPRGGAGPGPVVLRDPFGAIVALSSEAGGEGRSPVAWHLHASLDHLGAFAAYAGWFGWTADPAVDLGPELGRHQPFRWDGTGPIAGSMADLARRPGVHPQWLFFFPVPDLDGALDRVRSRGGAVLGRTRTARGDLAPCEDAQGAAFGLLESPPA